MTKNFSYFGLILVNEETSSSLVGLFWVALVFIETQTATWPQKTKWDPNETIETTIQLDQSKRDLFETYLWQVRAI